MTVIVLVIVGACVVVFCGDELIAESVSLGAADRLSRGDLSCCPTRFCVFRGGKLCRYDDLLGLGDEVELTDCCSPCELDDPSCFSLLGWLGLDRRLCCVVVVVVVVVIGKLENVTFVGTVDWRLPRCGPLVGRLVEEYRLSLGGGGGGVSISKRLLSIERMVCRLGDGGLVVSKDKSRGAEADRLWDCF